LEQIAISRQLSGKNADVQDIFAQWRKECKERSCDPNELWNDEIEADWIPDELRDDGKQGRIPDRVRNDGNVHWIPD